MCVDYVHVATISVYIDTWVVIFLVAETMGEMHGYSFAEEG